MIQGLYAISSPRTDVDPEEQLRLAILGGAKVVQLRAPELNDREFYRFAVRIRSITKEKHRTFIVDDRIHIALAVGADGVHLGRTDLPLADAKKLAAHQTEPFIIGISCSDLTDANAAERDGADYIGFGAIFKTDTRKDYHVCGLTKLKEACKKLKIPVVAIGGITLSNVKKVVDARPAAIACISSVCGASDIRRAAREMNNLIKGL